MTIFYPLIYLLSGWLLGKLARKTTRTIKKQASKLLTKIIIPVVIIWNISSHSNSMGGIIIGAMVIMAVLLKVGGIINDEPIKKLCFCYLNIGWMGLPIAGALFGSSASTVMISVYIGSSVFGNSVGAGILSKEGFKGKKILLSSAALATILGILLIPLSEEFKASFEDTYNIAKFLMSFLGMVILGLWLSEASVTINDLRDELMPFLSRILVMTALARMILLFSSAIHLDVLTENSATLYLICLLPPAANIVVLETKYRGTGDSTKMIICGTFLSIIALIFYAVAILYYRTP